VPAFCRITPAGCDYGCDVRAAGSEESFERYRLLSKVFLRINHTACRFFAEAAAESVEIAESTRSKISAFISACDHSTTKPHSPIPANMTGFFSTAGISFVCSCKCYPAPKVPLPSRPFLHTHYLPCMQLDCHNDRMFRRGL
jgi:hypothetical protein